MTVMDNRSLIAKADLMLSDLTTDGGALQPAQAKQFMQTLIDESTVMPQATVVAMKSFQQNIDKAQFNSRVLRAGSEAQALSQGDRVKPDLDQETLNAKLFKAECRLDNETLEDNIESGSFKNTVMSMMGDRIGLDMDEVLVQGDLTHPTDAFLAKFDGIIVQASAHTVAAGGNPLTKTVLTSMMKALPTQYMRNKKRMRFLVSVDSELDYRAAIQQRETGVGDRYLEDDPPVSFGGVPMLDVPVMPENLGGGSNETVALLLDPKNIFVGIWRKVTIETDKDISAGVMVIVASIRFDVRFADYNAVVKATGITVS